MHTLHFAASAARPKWAAFAGTWVIALFCTHCFGQSFFTQVAKVRAAPPTAAPSTVPGNPTTAAAAPVIINFAPASGGAGATIVITGTNFDNNTAVTFGGTPAASIVVNSPTKISAVVGAGASGLVQLTNLNGAGNKTGFVFVNAPLPTITSVTHTVAGGNTTLTITGTNFVAPANVIVNGVNIYIATVSSPTTIVANIPGTPVIISVSVNVPSGTADYSAANPVQGNADLNIPDLGNGLVIIPTPSVDYSQINGYGKFGFTERIWANTLGVDSDLQKLGSQFLSPQISLFGFKVEGDLRFTDHTAPVSIGGALECNFLVKKVSYFDTLAKTSTNFNPFVIHTRLGLTSSMFQDNFFAALYCNVLSVVGSNTQFTKFFNSPAKNVFVFPELDFGGLISMGGSGNQAIKIQVNLIVNNGDAQFTSGTNDVIIPYVKIGFVTTL